MSQVVQAKCPGCQRVLRIPADWMQASMRCKHCGLVFQVKLKPAAPQSSPPPIALSTTTRVVSSADHATYTAATHPEAAPEPTVVPASDPYLQASAAQPETEVTPFLPVESPAPLIELSNAPAYRRRRSGGGWAKGVVLAFCLLAIGGIAGVVYWRGPELGSSDGVPNPSKGNKQSDKADKPKGNHDSKEPTDLPVVTGRFPRRLLAISVNNYLYANPVNYGSKAGNRDQTIHAAVERLANYLHVDRSQTALLSDGAPQTAARPPLKGIVELAVCNFLDSCRPQDRIILLFIGHAVDIGNDSYLVPLEGELDNKDTLIPLKWLYDRLQNCKARQKVLILDACRYDPGRGLERPGSGPLGPKLDAALQNPPPGVQVWTACTAGQYSYELENGLVYGGVFLDELLEAIGPDARKRAKIGIQLPEDSLPMAELAEVVADRTKSEMRKLARADQTPRLTGQEPPTGAAYNPDEPLPAKIALPPIPIPAGGLASKRDIQSILDETDIIPPVKPSEEGLARLKVEALPPFSAKVLAEYRDDGAKTPLREAIQQTIAALEQQKKTFPDSFQVPRGNEAEFKRMIREEQRGPAVAKYQLDQALKDMTEADKDMMKEKSKRWQANYLYVLARLQARMAYIYEHNYMLGQMRKELPPRDPKIHQGWKLASQEKLQSGAEARRLASESRKLLEKLTKEHPGTPWAVLARRERLTTLGLRWEPYGFGE